MPRSEQYHWPLRTWVMWAMMACICIVYGLFALSAGFGLAESEKLRALPVAFEIHALAGGIVLITGIIQFNPALRQRLLRGHRWCGRLHVLAVFVASVAAIANAAFFDVGPAARLSFEVLGLLWFALTAVAFYDVLRGRIFKHREWMLRSFSLSLFFVSFSVWLPVLTDLTGNRPTAYFWAVTLGWAFNLLVVEVWIRFTRRQRMTPARQALVVHS